jgi:hypothetical protein
VSAGVDTLNVFCTGCGAIGTLAWDSPRVGSQHGGCDSKPAGRWTHRVTPALDRLINHLQAGGVEAVHLRCVNPDKVMQDLVLGGARALLAVREQIAVDRGVRYRWRSGAALINLPGPGPSVDVRVHITSLGEPSSARYPGDTVDDGADASSDLPPRYGFDLGGEG